MTVQILIAVGSGSLVAFALGLVGGGGSILATPLLRYAVGISQPTLRSKPARLPSRSMPMPI